MLATEIDLHDGSAKLTQVIDTVSTLIGTIDRDGRFVFIDEGCGRLHGRAAHEMTGNYIRVVLAICTMESTQLDRLQRSPRQDMLRAVNGETWRCRGRGSLHDEDYILPLPAFEGPLGQGARDEL